MEFVVPGNEGPSTERGGGSGVEKNKTRRAKTRSN